MSNSVITPFEIPQGATKGVIIVNDHAQGMRWAFDTVQQAMDFSKSYTEGVLSAYIGWHIPD